VNSWPLLPQILCHSVIDVDQTISKCFRLGDYVTQLHQNLWPKLLSYFWKQEEDLRAMTTSNCVVCIKLETKRPWEIQGTGGKYTYPQVYVIIRSSSPIWQKKNTSWYHTQHKMMWNRSHKRGNELSVAPGLWCKQAHHCLVLLLGLALWPIETTSLAVPQTGQEKPFAWPVEQMTTYDIVR